MMHGYQIINKAKETTFLMVSFEGPLSEAQIKALESRRPKGTVVKQLVDAETNLIAKIWAILTNKRFAGVQQTENTPAAVRGEETV